MPTGERFRGSSELPLTSDGVSKAQELAIRLAQKGGLDEIQASSLGRTVHTAKIISQYTHAPITYIGDGLHPWHLGALEGQPLTQELVDLQHRLTDTEPDTPLPGRGPLSTSDGESFNSFRERAVAKLQELVRQHTAQPDRKIGVVTHYRVKKLLDAWVKNGMPPDGSVDVDEMNQHSSDNKPGGIEVFRNDPYTGPSVAPVDMDSGSRLGGGLYILRHEATAWNNSEGS